MYFRDCKTLSVFERKIPLTLEFKPNEMSATTISWPLEERHAYLEKEYQELEEQYRLVIDRVEKYQ
jgi:hypothetical protein